VGRLQVEPEFGSRVQRLGEEPSRLRRDTALPAYELVDALHRYPEMRRQRHLRLAQRDEKFLTENLTGMGRNAARCPAGTIERADPGRRGKDPTLLDRRTMRSRGNKLALTRYPCNVSPGSLTDQALSCRPALGAAQRLETWGL
jgi:hypothetical protein